MRSTARSTSSTRGPVCCGAVLMCSGSTFFSGADISEFSGPPQEEAYRALFNRLEGLAIPLVAAMHGTVLGGGLEIALACHYRIALPGTRFGMPEITLGVIPGAGGTQRMPRLIGVERTLELVFDAKPVDAATAVALGFLDAVVEGDLRRAAIDYATGLGSVAVRAAPVSARSIRRARRPRSSSGSGNARRSSIRGDWRR